ncbi:hypothetical protein B296_00044339 [Ensete ventricosum]|uniref:Uncharacterized protein n=1 Tax=Ensete ventricosum TaxID=4639 RepID=A0A426YWK9_ENSVE|nr:hypothetical protein B296_00044339 [Ensete ventricosum]
MKYRIYWWLNRVLVQIFIPQPLGHSYLVQWGDRINKRKEIQLYYLRPLGSLDESLARRPETTGDGRVVGDDLCVTYGYPRREKSWHRTIVASEYDIWEYAKLLLPEELWRKKIP